jgi:predicted PurR-regulated permease PerM
MIRNMPANRRYRLLLFATAALLVGWVLVAARRGLIPYLLGLTAAYLLQPLVRRIQAHLPSRLERWGIARPLAVVVVYLIVIILMAALVAYLVLLVSDQVGALARAMPQLAERGRELVEQGLGWYQENIPGDWRTRIESSLVGLANRLVEGLQRGVLATVGAVTSTVSFLLGMGVIPFWLFLVLNDEDTVTSGLMKAIPGRLRDDVLCVLRLTDDVLSAYIRGQLLLCLFIGALSTGGLLLLGVDYALLLGLIAGIFEVLPVIGPLLGAVPAVLVALLQGPGLALWTILLFLGIQQVENLLLAPRIAGKSVRLHPAMVMVVLVLGNELLGLWGMLLAVPISAVFRDLFAYAYLRLSDEAPTPAEVLGRIRAAEDVNLDV